MGYIVRASLERPDFTKQEKDSLVVATESMYYPRGSQRLGTYDD